MAEEKAHNAADPEAVKKKQEELEILRNQELEDVRWLLNQKAGMRFFQRLMEEGHIFSTTFTGDINGAFKEGHRNFALIFFNDIAEAAPAKIQELIVKKVKKDS